jgi:hypothetical protein
MTEEAAAMFAVLPGPEARLRWACKSTRKQPPSWPRIAGEQRRHQQKEVVGNRDPTASMTPALTTAR